MRRLLLRLVLLVAVTGVVFAVVDLLKTFLGDAGTGEKVLAGALVVVLLALAAPILRAARRH